MLDELRRRYIESGELAAILESEEIAILDAFLDNWENIERFYAAYYGDAFPRTVLCGINPGRLGAGKTGVPFVDFSSLSDLLEMVNRPDTERSAQFFYDVVSHFGPTDFFRSFYVTNVSWIGYAQCGKNRNYYELPTKAKEFVCHMFKYEMTVADPERIIALGKKVQDTIAQIFDKRIDSSIRLPHPNYCSFPKNYGKCKEQYIDTLSPYIRA